MRNVVRSVLLLCLLLTEALPTRALQNSTDNTPDLYLGASWYPEQWPESRWPEDLRLMEQAGVRFVRLGEFAWSTMEPEEGRYQFEWLDRAIELASRHGISTVLGTPTAAPPAWLTEKYPETLRVKEDGRRDEHGRRRQFNWTNRTYRRFSRKIAEELAKRYGHNPNVIGWQIDNEFGNPSFDEETKKEFQEWLKTHYQTLDNLNQRWTTAYWSQTYSDWSQIPMETEDGNPGLLLSWKRFATDVWRDYQKNQLKALRAHCDSRQFISTNLTGWFADFDHYTIAQDLDLVGSDDYVGEGQADPARMGATHDLARGFLRKNFWVMETQPGFVNWAAVNTTLDKGETRALAWQEIGHGADAVSYWQWRSARNGQEQYHGTLLGADGTPLPVYSEIAQIGREFARAGPALAHTSVHSSVALLNSYESRWAIDWQRHNQNFSPVAQLLSFYKPLRQLAQSVDIVSPTAPLDGYKLVVAPGLNVLPDAVARHLAEYVKNGGHLVLGQRTGMKNEDNALWLERQPGPLAEILGARVEQYFALDGSVNVDGVWGKGETKLWAETLSASAPDVDVLLRYTKSNGWLDGQPAAITRKVGRGRITYLGAWLDEATMARGAQWMADTSGIRPQFGPVLDGVEVNLRSRGEHQVFVLINFSDTPKTIPLPRQMHDVLQDREISAITLDHYGVAVVESNQ